MKPLKLLVFGKLIPQLKILITNLSDFEIHYISCRVITSSTLFFFKQKMIGFFCFQFWNVLLCHENERVYLLYILSICLYDDLLSLIVLC